MNQEKIGELIKNIRKQNNLTQAEFAKKYGVTYQAVSKWENGKNIPDISLLKQISEDFNIDIKDLLDGKKSERKKIDKKLFIIPSIVLVIIISLVILILINWKQEDFEFKKLSSNCDNFDISGSIAYNQHKSSIFISDIDYCGEEDNNNYLKIVCTLYEVNDKTKTKISTYTYDKQETTKLADFFENVQFSIDDYMQSCGFFDNNTLHLEVEATTKDGKTTYHKIPISLEENCTK